MLGIDKDIAIIQDAYNKYLWADSDYFGRVFPNQKKGGIIPEIATTNVHYKEVLLNDKKACTSFFYVLPDRSNPATVWIHFAINLKKIYPTLNRIDASEKALLQAEKVTETAGYSVINKVTGIDSYDTWTYISQSKMDMQPYFLFRLECEIFFDNICEDEERTTYNLNLSTDGNGITEPFEGSEAKAINSIQPINAVANNGFQFKEWLINGVQDLNRLTTVLMDKTVNAIAYFENSLNIIQDVFGTVPVNQTFEDQSGNNNDVTYKNVQVADFATAGFIKYPNQYINGGDRINVAIKFKYAGINATLFSAGGQRSSEKGIILRVSSSKLGIILSDGTSLISIVSNDLLFVGGTMYTIEFDWDGVSATPDVLKVNGADINFNGILLGWTGQSFNEIKVGVYPDESTRRATDLFYCFLLESTVNIDSCFQDGDDDLVINRAIGGANGVVENAILADFRGTYVDDSESELIKNGYSLFIQIADPTKIITAPYDNNGQPTETSISGYQAPIEIPANVVSDNRILYDGLQGSISGTNNTYDEINALTTPEYEVAKTANYISNVKVNA